VGLTAASFVVGIMVGSLLNAWLHIDIVPLGVRRWRRGAQEQRGRGAGCGNGRFCCERASLHDGIASKACGRLDNGCGLEGDGKGMDGWSYRLTHPRCPCVSP
jgi:hypothetical protein